MTQFIQRGEIEILEYQELSDGSKHYQIKRRTKSFTHVSFLTRVKPSEQGDENLVALAMQRFGV